MPYSIGCTQSICQTPYPHPDTCHDRGLATQEPSPQRCHIRHVTGAVALARFHLPSRGVIEPLCDHGIALEVLVGPEALRGSSRGARARRRLGRAAPVPPSSAFPPPWGATGAWDEFQ